VTASSRHTREMRRLAREEFGFAALRPEQEQVIHAVLDHRDTLAVMPTGAGKSATYQLAALLEDGPAVVISPLIALQRDQATSLEATEAAQVAMINSALTVAERRDALEQVANREVNLLFMAPEQFHDDAVLDRVRSARPSLFVVDEAHCISEWGDDFRPDYLRLGAVIEALGHPTVLALTATASPRVRQEIVDRLGMHAPLILVTGFDRPNIWLGVEQHHDPDVKQRALLERVAGAQKPGIVYVATHRHAEEIAAAIQAAGTSAIAYHAGLKKAERAAAEAAFLGDEVDVIVATSAFGMGIDKPDVRFVFHADIPESIDAYYQEVGRAGRDSEPAEARLYYRPEDLNLHRFFAGTGQVDEEDITRVTQALRKQDAPAEPAELKEVTGLSGAKITAALSRLEDLGAVEVLPGGEVVASEVRPLDAVTAEAAALDRQRHEVARSRIEMMRGYAELLDCRRGYLLNYFGEPFEPPCGNCDRCDAGMVSERPDETPFPIGSRVAHDQFGTGVVQRYDADSMIVLFDDAGYRTLLTDFVIETGALVPAKS